MFPGKTQILQVWNCWVRVAYATLLYLLTLEKRLHIWIVEVAYAIYLLTFPRKPKFSCIFGSTY